MPEQKTKHDADPWEGIRILSNTLAEAENDLSDRLTTLEDLVPTIAEKLLGTPELFERLGEAEELLRATHSDIIELEQQLHRLEKLCSKP